MCMVSYRWIRGQLVKALPSPIVGLVRLCLGSTMTSSDLPPDLHSNHKGVVYEFGNNQDSGRETHVLQSLLILVLPVTETQGPLLSCSQLNYTLMIPYF